MVIEKTWAEVKKHGMIIYLQKELACIILGNTAGGRTENDIFLLGAPCHCEAFISVGVQALTEIKKNRAPYVEILS